jgi:hypothetical protein
MSRASGARRRPAERALVAALALSAGLPLAGRASDAPRAHPDADLLEFLGSDDQDPELEAYLARSEARAARESGQDLAKEPAKAPPAELPGDAKSRHLDWSERP